MKKRLQFLSYLIVGIIFILIPTILQYGWRQFNSVALFLIGSWFIGEAFSLIKINGYSDQIKNVWNNFPRILVGLGSIFVIISLFLVWFKTEQPLYGVTLKYGYDTDGLIVGLASLAILLTALFRKGVPRRSYSLFCTIWGIYLLFYLIYEIASLSTSVFIFMDLGAKLGMGPNICLLGIIVVIVGGVLPVNSAEDN